jgi:hypothetical protein
MGAEEVVWHPLLGVGVWEEGETWFLLLMDREVSPSEERFSKE